MSDRRSPTETFGDIFDDGSILDLTRDETGSLQLLFWDGSNSSISSEVEKNGKKFIPPMSLDGNLLRAIQFPTRACLYGSTEKLIKDLHNWFAQHPGLPDASISMLSYFVLSACFPECNAVLPCLFVFAPDTSGSDLLLHLLWSVCRHCLRVTEMTEDGIFALPFALRPTLLIEQANLTNRLQGTLRAMGRPGVLVPRSGQYRDISCPIVVCSGQPLSESRLPDAVQVVLLPTRGSLPRIDRQSPNVAAEELRGKLLQYRLTNFKKVQESQFEAPELNSPIADIARTLGSSVVDNEKLQQHVIQLLKPQDQELRVQNSTRIIEIVIEAALSLCHEKNRDSAYVGELATVANVILKGRNEIIQLDPRGVGDVMRAIGLFSQRLGSAGRGILLFNETKQKIHRLARAYNVLSVQDGIDRCRFCIESRMAVVTSRC